MTDQRSRDELEHRLASGLRHADLPGAPASLRDALERVPDAPVRTARARATGRGRTSASAWGLLGLAAVLLLGGALALGVGGLRPGPSAVVDPTPNPPAPSPAATQPVSPSPVASGSPEPEPTFPLVRFPGDLGCDSIRPPYRSWVFHLDPDAAEPVWAIADTGARLRVGWGSEFRGLVGPPPVIVDGEGLVVVREGTAGTMPDAAWPTLGDHFVCPGPETLYVFDESPGG